MKTTDEDLKKMNPWKDYSFEHLYNDEYTDLIHKADKEVIEKYNEKKDEDHKFIKWVPAIPFQGNPYTAKVIFLSLNPGYVEKLNKDAAKFLRNNCKKISEDLAKHWHKHLTHEVNSMMPSKEENENLYTAFQLIGDWYWVEKLEQLKTDTKLSDKEFYEKVALIELMPYSSRYCNDITTELTTQEYTRNLIKHLLKRSKSDKPLFVVMRSEKYWRKLLFDNENNNFENNKDFIIRKRDSKGRPLRAQSINGNAFLNLNVDYDRIKSKISLE